MAIKFLTLNNFMLRLSFTSQMIIYILSFLEPDMPEGLYFSNVNIIKFLYYFQHLNKKHEVNDKDLIKMFPDYCEREKRS